MYMYIYIYRYMYIQGTTIRAMKGDARSLECGSKLAVLLDNKRDTGQQKK